jgi:hypothetical protein
LINNNIGIAIRDRMNELYFKTFKKQDFAYLERGLRNDKELELLVSGTLYKVP